MVSKYISVKQKTLLKQHKYILKKLVLSNDKDRRVIFENAPLELFEALRILFKLLADKKLNLTSSQERRLTAHKQLIHSTSSLKGVGELQKKLIRYRRGVTNILRVVLPAI